ncbi:hypothetical protein EIK77_009958 [Talaromyces pinophilus]|nr:hypothetical protein EIK77_009958 [Talaromyces pinophilus]
MRPDLTLRSQRLRLSILPIRRTNLLQIIPKVIEENHKDNRLSNSRILVILLSIDGRENSPNDEANQHANRTNQIDRSTPPSINKETEEDVCYEGECGQSSIDHQLCLRVRDSDIIHDRREIV